jgi:hypothetical protein
MIDVSSMPSHLKRSCVKLNALGSLFYFAKAVLGYGMLNHTLHWNMAASVEKEELSDVFEYPRGHLKTTIYSHSAPIWWALPFDEEDEALMRGLGYGDEWIRWMRRAHDQNTSTIIISETDENAEAMGEEISAHYETNDLFRHLWPQILPDRSCTWNKRKMKQKRKGSADKQGTFELAGVGKAMQSKHANRIVEDDLFGEKALFSPSEAEFTISFHQKLPGLFKPDPMRPHHVGDIVVVGNRWGLHDLNGWIRKNQSTFRFETHAVDGGCCNLHPKGKFIFPEVFNEQKLAVLREQLGPSNVAAQYYNNPLDDSVRRFRHEWLKHYLLVKTPNSNGILDEDGELKMVTTIRHEVVEGKIERDIYISQLQRFIVIDVLHNENSSSRGRSRHCVLTIGYLPGKEPRFYLLNIFAKRCSYTSMADEVFRQARRWRVSTVWVETLAGQDGWLYYFRERNLSAQKSGLQRPLKIESLKKDRSPDAKHRRICSLEPLFFSGSIYATRQDSGYEDFKSEYDSYPSDQTIDTLDTLGYAPQCIEAGGQDREEIARAMRQREAMITSQMGAAGY